MAVSRVDPLACDRLEIVVGVAVVVARDTESLG